MAKIKSSTKLSVNQEEYCIRSAPYVFYRLISDVQGWRLMTATASEDDNGFKAYEDADRLLAATAHVLEKHDIEYEYKDDRAGRRYIEARVEMARDYLEHLATMALDQIGFDDLEVSALRDGRAIFEEFVADDGVDEAYLGDGMWMTSDGRLVDK